VKKGRKNREKKTSSSHTGKKRGSTLPYFREKIERKRGEESI